MTASKGIRKLWTAESQARLAHALSTESQINIPELAKEIGYEASTTRRKLSSMSSEMGLSLSGIKKKDICVVKKKKPKADKTAGLPKFVCRCNSIGGVVHIVASAIDAESAKTSVMSQYPRLTVTQVFTQEEHNKNNRIKSSPPGVVKDVKFGKSTTKRSVL